MAATAWKFYNQAKKKLGQDAAGARISLDAGVFKMSLHTSASDASVVTQSLMGQISGEIVAQGGYVAGGRNLASVVWTVAGDPSSVKFDAADLVFTANAANLSLIKYAVIHYSTTAALTSGHLICYSKLSASQFSVTTGNTLTIQFAADGIFTLT
jgi:hypothetical protein